MTTQANFPSIYSEATQQFLHQLGIAHPIFKAPMAGTSTPELAAAVSNAGGLGALGLGAMSLSDAEKSIKALKQLTSKPYQLNFFCHQSVQPDLQRQQDWIEYLRYYFALYNAEPPQTLRQIYGSFLDDDERLELVLATKPKAVSFHFGIPHQHQLNLLKKAGILIFATATNLAEAQLIEKAGLDAIIAQGIEAGGHRGLFNPQIEAGIPTRALTSLLVKHIKLPIIATGGLMDGAAIFDVLQQGAVAAQLGTAFVTCQESAASPHYRARLLDPEHQFTQLTASISGRPARGLINRWQTLIDQPHRPDIAEYPYAYDLAKQLLSAATAQQDENFSVMWAGSNVHQIRNLDAGELMQTLIAELAAQVNKPLP